MSIPTKQREKLNAMLGDLHDVYKARLLNAIEQAYEQHSLHIKALQAIPDAQRWTTARVKAQPDWQRLSDAQKQAVSVYMDALLFEAQGHDGCVTERGLKAYYKPEHNASTPIMETRFVL